MTDEDADSDLPAAKMLTDRLLYEGYLQVTRHSNRHRASQKSSARYKFVRSKEQLARMQARYFDPLALISHHVCSMIIFRASIQHTSHKLIDLEV